MLCVCFSSFLSCVRFCAFFVSVCALFGLFIRSDVCICRKLNMFSLLKLRAVLFVGSV